MEAMASVVWAVSLYRVASPPVPDAATALHAVAIVAAAILLAWPAWLNLYPILFADTAAYLRHTLTGEAPWDKTAAYGPCLQLFHQNVSLWPPMLAQALIVSHVLWLVQRVACGDASMGLHLLVAIALATLSAAPWFVATLMPDAFTALVALGLFLLGFGEKRLSRPEQCWVGLVTALAIAVHLSHLPQAFALLVLILLVRWQAWPVLRGAAPMLAAMLFLLVAKLARLRPGDALAAWFRLPPGPVAGGWNGSPHAAGALPRRRLGFVRLHRTLSHGCRRLPLEPREPALARCQRAGAASGQMQGALDMIPHAVLQQPVLILSGGLILLAWWRLARRATPGAGVVHPGGCHRECAGGGCALRPA